MTNRTWGFAIGFGIGISLLVSACSGGSTTANSNSTGSDSADGADSDGADSDGADSDGADATDVTDGTDGSDGTTDGNDSTDAGDGSDATDSADGSDAADATDGVDATDGSAGSNACTEKSQCSGAQGCHEGMCILEPETAAVLTDNETDNPVDGEPNLDCVGKALVPSGKTATVYGIIDRFGDGRPTYDMEVTIFKASDWPPATCAALTDPAEAHTCFREFKEGGLSTSDLTLPTDEAEGNECKRHTDCPVGYECIEKSSIEYRCEPNYGLYEIAGVPTNTPLVIRTRNLKPLLESKWKDTYVYNAVVLEDHLEEGGRFRINALMVSSGQWVTVPTTLGAGQIAAGNGAVGGRIRDCNTADRRGYTIGFASVALEEPGTATGYFNDNEYDTVPLVNKSDTDIFGRFTIVDVPQGWNRLAGVVKGGDGKVASLGSESFYLVPDSLVVLAFPGKLPIFTK